MNIEEILKFGKWKSRSSICSKRSGGWKSKFQRYREAAPISIMRQMDTGPAQNAARANRSTIE
ncbi:MAG: hypothetical protein ACQEUD_05515 [Bacillota bacterium]